MTDPRDKPSFASMLRRARGKLDEEQAAASPSFDLPEPAPPPAPVPAPPPVMAPPPFAPEPAPANQTARNEWAFEAMQFLVDPARVRIWPGNARAYAKLTPDNCRDLINSIAQEGMQKVAAIVRPVFDDEHYEYEVIAGTRRHFAVSYLRNTTMPELRYLVQVEILDDEAAFMLADLENRVRTGISDVERARNYAAALDKHYDGHVGRMAQRLALPREILVQMIRIADLPDDVIDAFNDPAELTLGPAYEIALALDGPDGQRVLATAQQIARAQAARRSDREPPYAPNEVIAQLLDVDEASLPPAPIVPSVPIDEQVAPAANAAELMGPNGQLVLSVPRVERDRLTFHLHAGSGASIDEILDAVRTILEAAKDGGFALDD